MQKCLITARIVVCIKEITLKFLAAKVLFITSGVPKCLEIAALNNKLCLLQQTNIFFPSYSVTVITERIERLRNDNG